MNRDVVSCSGAGKGSASQEGFTLVELAIVLVIIGLIIGGVLKGQELIDSARVKNLLALTDGYKAAVATFQDKYTALPGDITNPSTRIPSCSGPCAVAGDGNGQIGASAGANLDSDLSNGAENVAFWQQLAAANLITGVVVGSTTVSYGEQFPASPTGGGFQVIYDGNRNVNVLRLQGGVAAPSPTNGSLTPGQAFQVDTTLDDGNPTRGEIFTNASLSDDGGSDRCVDITTEEYVTANDDRNCNMIIGLR